MHETNPELRLAEAFVEETDCPVFLTGKAGTGKTTFLQELAGRTSKRLIVTAPTGVAAINAGGVTLHSFFQLPFGPMVPGDTSFFARHRFSRDKRNIVRSLDLLVIDEISMVRADLLDGVDAVLRRYRGTLLNDQSVGSEILYNSLTEVFTVKGGDTSKTAANPTGRVRAMLTPIPEEEKNGPAAPATDPATLRPSGKITEPKK